MSSKFRIFFYIHTSKAYKINITYHSMFVQKPPIKKKRLAYLAKTCMPQIMKLSKLSNNEYKKRI